MPTLDEEQRFLAAILDSSNSTILLAEQDGGIVGALDFQGYARPQMRHGGLLAMSVARAYRRRGIGRALLEELSRWAANHGVTRLELEAFSNNPEAIRLYERVGFRQ